jgi:glycerate dehydrogenase
MNFKKILMLGFADGDLDEKHWERLNAVSDKVVILPRNAPEIVASLTDCDCLLLKLGMTADKGIINRAPELRYIGMFGTGVGNIDVKYARSKGITTCNLYYATEAVAELGVGLVLETLREISRAQAQGNNAKRKPSPSASDFSEDSYNGYEIQGKRVGIIGAGRIGARFGEIMKNGFGAEVSYWSRDRKPPLDAAGIKFTVLDELLAESDIVSLHLAHVAGETTHVLNGTNLPKMKSGSVLLNLSPMELIDLTALQTRLKQGDLTFVFDHTDEITPVEITSLAKHDNCVMYPPIGYTTHEAAGVKKEVFIKNLEDFVAGAASNVVK